jgi:hypothetical protein
MYGFKIRHKNIKTVTINNIFLQKTRLNFLCVFKINTTLLCIRTFHATTSLCDKHNADIIPVVVYNDANTQKAQILEDNKDKAGVYR